MYRYSMQQQKYCEKYYTYSLLQNLYPFEHRKTNNNERVERHIFNYVHVAPFLFLYYISPFLPSLILAPSYTYT